MAAREPLQLDLLVDEAGSYLTIAEAARRVRVCERTIRFAVVEVADAVSKVRSLIEDVDSAGRHGI